MQHEPTFVGADLAFLRQGGAYLALLALPPGESPLVGSRAQRGHFAMRVDGRTFWALHSALPRLLECHRARPEQSVDIMCDDFSVQLSLFFYDPDGNEVEITTWDCERDGSCSRFGEIDERSIRGDTTTAAAAVTSLVVPRLRRTDPPPLSGVHVGGCNMATVLALGVGVVVCFG